MGPVETRTSGGMFGSTKLPGSFQKAIKSGRTVRVKEILATAGSSKEKLVNTRRTMAGMLSVHLAAESGHSEVVALLLANGAAIDSQSYTGLTPLMIASKQGHSDVVASLLEKGANALIFDKTYGRTCLHYAAEGGHSDCISKIISAAKEGPVAETWGFERFLSCRDREGRTALHLASLKGVLSAVRILLEAGAMTMTSTTRSGMTFSATPLHLAAQIGRVEVVRELLAWGADRNARDIDRKTPFDVARQYNHPLCAALLDPQSAEPLVWPSPWKFMAKLDTRARELLEAALISATAERTMKQEELRKAKEAASQEAKEREKQERGGSKKGLWRGLKFKTGSGMAALTSGSRLVPVNSEGSMPREHEEEHQQMEVVEGAQAADLQDDDAEECQICFERPCNIEVENCRHQMCATCMLALCCHCKPNHTSPAGATPACPFCRQEINRLVAMP